MSADFRASNTFKIPGFYIFGSTMTGCNCG